jgi:hypothetical protein
MTISRAVMSARGSWGRDVQPGGSKRAWRGRVQREARERLASPAQRRCCRSPWNARSASAGALHPWPARGQRACRPRKAALPAPSPAARWPRWASGCVSTRVLVVATGGRGSRNHRATGPGSRLPPATRGPPARSSGRTVLASVASSQGKLPSPSSHRTGLVDLTSGASGRAGSGNSIPYSGAGVSARSYPSRA